MIYAAVQLQVLRSVSDSWQQRSDFVSAVARGEKRLSEQQAINLLRFSFDVEAKRSAAISATRDLIAWLAGIAVVSCIVLVVGIRSVPREHWPKFSMRRRADA